MASIAKSILCCPLKGTRARVALSGPSKTSSWWFPSLSTPSSSSPALLSPSKQVSLALSRSSFSSSALPYLVSAPSSSPVPASSLPSSSLRSFSVAYPTTLLKSSTTKFIDRPSLMTSPICRFSSAASSPSSVSASSQQTFNMSCDSLLTEEQLQLKERTREFAEKEIAPLAEKCDEGHFFPREILPKMGEFGLLGPTVPLDYGGLGYSYLEHCLIIEELSRASGGIALAYGAHSNLCVNQIARWGTEEQKEKYLPKLLDGSFLGALAMSEPGSGSDVVSMATRAAYKGAGDGDDDGFYLMNGTKMWCTNGPQADVFVVYAKTGADEQKPKGLLTAFILERGMEGFSVGKPLNKLGMRSSETSELIFENVKVPKKNILGKEGKGVNVLMSGLDSERLVLAAGPIGIMQSCWDLAFPYVNERKQFGQFIGDFQLMQGKIADMYTTLVSHRAFLYTTAKAYSEGKAGRVDCAAAILTCAEKATWMALQTIQLLGGNGYINDYAAGRFLRDAKLYEIGAGTSEIRRMLIGRELNNGHRSGLI